MFKHKPVVACINSVQARTAELSFDKAQDRKFGTLNIYLPKTFNASSTHLSFEGSTTDSRDFAYGIGISNVETTFTGASNSSKIFDDIK